MNIAELLKYIAFPVIGFLFGLLAQWFLQSRKSRDELLKELSARRSESLAILWRLTTQFARSSKKPIPLAQRITADDAFLQWYYENSGALFLSWQSTRRYIEAIACLRNTQSNTTDLRVAFSRLRTALKRDFGIYSWANTWRSLPKPGAPLSEQQTSVALPNDAQQLVGPERREPNCKDEG